DRAFVNNQARGMPLLIYVADPSTRTQPARYFDDHAQDGGQNCINTLGTDPQSQVLARKLDAFRTLLMSRHLCKLFTVPEELALQFSTDLSVTIRGGYASQGHILQAEQALRRGDLTTARAEAQLAVADLPGNSTGGDSVVAARARFLLALATLGSQPVM